MSASIIYGLVDPRTKRVRYIGQSSVGLRRAKMHKYDPRYQSTKHTHASRWIATLQQLGLTYEITTLEQVAPEDLSIAERWWISFGRACGWPLTNITAGGDGFDTSASQRANKTRWADPQAHEVASKQNVMKRPQERAATKARVKAQWSDPAMRIKMVAAMKGKRHR